VLITGHTGFKGSWLLLWLESLGAEVFGLALDAPSQPSLFALACDMGGRDGRIDLRARAAVLNAVAAARPEVVIHMAAQALVRASYRDPMET
jgi:CDP-glucose 4,6-dehydratase